MIASVLVWRTVGPSPARYTVIWVTGIAEFVERSTEDANSPARTSAEPKAAIIAPLSVQYLIGGIRTVIPASAHRTAARPRSRELAENPPPITRVSTPCSRHAAIVLA